jgi:DNA-binding response OmpR family regulator
VFQESEVSMIEFKGDAEPEPGQRRLLVLEDDRSIRETSVAMLQRAGFVVDSAEDGEAGWEEMCKRPYDLVVTDHDMPRLTGFDLLCRMRAAGINWPVVLVTGSMNLDSRILEFFAAVLPKPYFLYELVITVQRVLIQTARTAKKNPPEGADAPHPEHLLHS